MKQYVYKASEIGLREWPSGTLRLEGIEVTENPELADVFTIPGALTALFPNRESLYRLPYMKGREQKHCAFDCSDHEQLYSMPCMFIRCNTRNWYFAKDPNTISWPWPVASFGDSVAVPESGFSYDVSCHAWTSTQTRIDSMQSCLDNKDLKSDIKMFSQFTGYIGTPGRPEYDAAKFEAMTATFRRSMQESRVCLCPESIPGTLPYRFLESLSAGRVPCLVGSDYVLPWADRIPYEQFCLFLPRERAANAGSLIREFIRNTSDEQIIAMGRMARHYWETWLDRDKWASLMATAVREKIEALQCA